MFYWKLIVRVSLLYNEIHQMLFEKRGEGKGRAKRG
jgi:hypothetical protein